MWLQARHLPCKATRLPTKYHAMSSEAENAAADSVKGIDKVCLKATLYQDSGRNRILSKTPVPMATSLLFRRQGCTMREPYTVHIRERW